VRSSLRAADESLPRFGVKNGEQGAREGASEMPGRQLSGTCPRPTRLPRQAVRGQRAGKARIGADQQLVSALDIQEVEMRSDHQVLQLSVLVLALCSVAPHDVGRREARG